PTAVEQVVGAADEPGPYGDAFPGVVVDLADPVDVSLLGVAAVPAGRTPDERTDFAVPPVGVVTQVGDTMVRVAGGRLEDTPTIGDAGREDLGAVLGHDDGFERLPPVGVPVVGDAPVG